jgi:LacI family transcriptional regulator
VPKHSNSLDVAKLAGVSQTTVSFVLNQRGDHSISEETRQRVLKAAHQLQYRSNRLSNGVFRGNTGLIGVVSPQITDDYYAHLLSSVSSHCASSGKTVIYSPVQDEDQPKRDPMLSLIEYRVEGIICVCAGVIGGDLSDWLDELAQKGIKCVVIDDRSYEGKVHCIVSDDVTGVHKVVQHLTSLGHRHIAHLGAGEGYSTAINRRAGFVAAMAELCVSESELLIAGNSFDEEEGREAARKIIGSPNRPTAIIAANDVHAAEVIKVMKSFGLRCPEDISVAGYGNTQVARALDMTSVDQQPGMIGHEAMESLLTQAHEQSSLLPTKVIDCRLVVRSTTGPCPK